jgi:ferric-dicitrate binding protein FerR (iron transport regulator)
VDGERGSPLGVALREGEPVAAGMTLQTGPAARVALRLSGGGSLRMDVDTRLRLISATDVSLESGMVYLDSGRSGAHAGAVSVHTPMGLVRETGTQFEVRVEKAILRVRVREGSVHLDGSAGSHEAGRGEELQVEGPRFSRRPAPLQGATWDWVQGIAPEFDLEGRSLSGFLDWVSRETGRNIRYADDRTARAAAAHRLHGSVEGLTPEQALEAVLPASGLPYGVIDGQLVVGVAGDRPKPPARRRGAGGR